MKTILSYPIPFNLWQHYRPQVCRFARTFKEFPPGADYVLHVSCIWGEPTDAIRRLFYGTKTVFRTYNEDGCDIGAAQSLASSTLEEGFLLALTTHNYFDREGWLKRFVDARVKYGPGLYGASASFETRLHLRTAGFGLDTDLWRSFPYRIVSRSDCTEFETGRQSITSFAQYKGWPIKQILWDDAQDIADCRKPAGVFRDGEQNAMLWKDRHSEIYEKADAEEKERLRQAAIGVANLPAEA